VSKDVESRFRVLLQETNLVGDITGQTSYRKVTKSDLFGIRLDVPSRMRPMLQSRSGSGKFEDKLLTVACGPGV
jgi:hypothetical protein